MLSSADQQEFKIASEKSPHHVRELAARLIPRYQNHLGKKPFDQHVVKSRETSEENGSDYAGEELPAEAWDDGRDREGMVCSSCGTPISQRTTRYCKQCLAPVCKRCFKGDALCPQHFDRLPEETRAVLARKARYHRIEIAVAVAGLVMFMMGIITPFIIGVEHGTTLPPHVIIGLTSSFAGIGVGLLAAQLADQNKMKVYSILKKSNIRLKFSEREGARYICDACGDRTPAWTGGRAARPYRCLICSKTLCVNCYSENRLCPEHEAELSSDDRQTFEHLKKSEKNLFIGMIVWACSVILWLMVGTLTSNEIMISYWVFLFLVGMLAFILLAISQSRKEKQAGTQIRLGRRA